MRSRFTFSVLFFLIICSGLCLLFCSEGKSDGTKLRENAASVVLADNGDQKQAATAENTAQDGTPKIMFFEKSFDFGNVSQGEKVSHKFIIQNTGNAPLKLIRAKGS